MIGRTHESESTESNSKHEKTVEARWIVVAVLILDGSSPKIHAHPGNHRRYWAVPRYFIAMPLVEEPGLVMRFCTEYKEHRMSSARLVVSAWLRSLMMIGSTSRGRTRGAFVLNTGSDFRRRSAPTTFRTNNHWLRKVRTGSPVAHGWSRVVYETYWQVVLFDFRLAASRSGNDAGCCFDDFIRFRI
jgi:hypothetical protein